MTSFSRQTGRIIVVAVALTVLSTAGVGATAYEEPTSDVQTGWLCNGGSCGTGQYAVIDDGVRQPTEPDIADYIYNPAGSSSVSEVRFPTVLYDPSSITLWVYASTPNNQGFNFNLHEDFYRCGTYVSSQTASWFSCTWNGIDPGNELSDLRARFDGCSGGGPNECRVYAAYISIEYTPSPPSVSYEAPTPADGSVQSQEYAPISAAATDDLTVSSCTLQFDGVNTTMAKTGTGTATCTQNVTGLSEGQHTFRVFATDSTGQVGAAEQRTFSIDRTAPAVDAPAFADYPDRHAFNVSAVVTDPHIAGGSCHVYVDDGNGNAYEFAGELDEGYGTSSEALCTYSNINDSLTSFDPTESISVKVTADDSVGNRGNSTVVAHDIPNRAPNTPVAPQLDVPELDFVTEHHPNLAWTDAGDVEGDDYDIEVYVQEDGGLSVLETTVPGPGTLAGLGGTVQLVPGRDYNVTLQACDAWDCSVLTAPISFHINDIPLINDVAPNDTTQAPDTEIAIETTVTDLEDTLQWVRFTVWNETAGTQVMTGQDGTQSGDTWTSPSFTTVSSGTIYNYTVTAYDGYENALPVTGAFEIGNVPPVIEDGPIFTDYPDRHAFNVSAIVSDTSDAELTNYTITLGDMEGNVYSFTRDLDTAFGGADQAAANFSSVSTDLSGFEPGEDIHVTMTFRDAEGDATPSGVVSHILPNRDPVVTGLDVQPQSPTTTDDLSFDFNASDVEDDPVSCNDVTWFQDNETVSSQQTIDEDMTTKGEQWMVQIRCADAYGGVADPVNSSSVTIQNTPVTLLEPLAAENVSGEHAVRFTTRVQDADGISDLDCDFGYGNQSHWYTGTDELLTSAGFNDTPVCQGTVAVGDQLWITVGTQVNASMTVTDGETTIEQGNLTGTIPNQPPVVSLLGPSDGTALTSRDVSFIWAGSDQDDDALNYTFQLYQDGDLLESTPAGTSLFRTLDPGSYTWEILVSDRYNDRVLLTRPSEERSFTITTPSEDNGGGGGGGPRDLSPPQITDLGPDDRVTPGEETTLRFAVADVSPVEVGAEYFNDGSWHAMEVIEEGDGRYSASFTPAEGTYTVRIVARDAGGRESTLERTVTAGFEPSWVRTPARLNRESGDVGEALVFDPIEVRNTGDTSVTIDIRTSEASDALTIETPETITVPAGASRRFAPEASLRAGGRPGIYTFQVVMESGQPRQRQVTESTAVFTADHPLILLEIVKGFQEEARAGEDLSMPVRATNVGGQAADNVWIGIDLPAGWTSTEATNVSVGRIEPDESRQHVFQVRVPEDAEGDQVIGLVGSSIDGGEESRYNASSPIRVRPSEDVEDMDEREGLLPLLLWVIASVAGLIIVIIAGQNPNRA